MEIDHQLEQHAPNCNVQSPKLSPNQRSTSGKTNQSKIKTKFYNLAFTSTKAFTEDEFTIKQLELMKMIATANSSGIFNISSYGDHDVIMALSNETKMGKIHMEMPKIVNCDM